MSELNPNGINETREIADIQKERFATLAETFPVLWCELSQIADHYDEIAHLCDRVLAMMSAKEEPHK